MTEKTGAGKLVPSSFGLKAARGGEGRYSGVGIIEVAYR